MRIINEVKTKACRTETGRPEEEEEDAHTKVLYEETESKRVRMKKQNENGHQPE